MQGREIQYLPVMGLQHRADVKPLTVDEIRFEIDMCIGCDRCMLACPVPLSSMVNIADLNHATVFNQVAPHIVQFTSECVMCGSCVPGCPVDNHRDLLMLSLKQRLGPSWTRPVDLALIQQKLPAGWTMPYLLSRLREQPLFRDPQLVPDTYLLHLAAESQVEIFASGAVALQEGTFSRDTYWILEGQFELSSLGPDGMQMPVAILGRGENMGDHAMLTGQQQQATASALTEAVALVVPEQVMQRLMEMVPPIQHYFEQLSAAHSIEMILKRTALLQGIADDALRWEIRAVSAVLHAGTEQGERIYRRASRLVSSPTIL